MMVCEHENYELNDNEVIQVEYDFVIVKWTKHCPDCNKDVGFEEVRYQNRY